MNAHTTSAKVVERDDPEKGGDRFLDLARARSPLQRILSFTSRMDVVVHDLKSPQWHHAPLTMACLTDFHAMRPWSPVARLNAIVDATNEMKCDIIFLLGDYISAHLTPGLKEKPEQIAEIFTRLEAPLGVHAILGNHDWLDDDTAPETGFKTSAISQALTKVGMRPLINTSRRITHRGGDIWIVGLDSQWGPKKGGVRHGRHDPEQAYAEVPDDATSILLAHEPDYFVKEDRRSLLQLSGHTHGGQANFFGWRPFTPSDYHQKYAYGHVEEHGRHLVTSGGLGYTHVPMRIAVPPEITLVRMSGTD